jgi:hypothetical protein
MRNAGVPNSQTINNSMLNADTHRFTSLFWDDGISLWFEG